MSAQHNNERGVPFVTRSAVAENREALYQVLTEHFSVDEIRTLCFFLKVDYDDLDGEGKTGKVRELISYMGRRERIEELVAEVRRQRPNVAMEQSDQSRPEKTPKPSTREATKRAPLTPYSLLPYELQNAKLLQDLSRLVGEAHGAVKMPSNWPSPTHVVLPIRGEPYVLRLILLRKCTLKMEMWQHIHTAWDYEHGALVIVMGSVASRAFPPVYPPAMPQHSPTGWGWFTMFNLPTAQVFTPTLQAALPKNTTAMSFACFTLPQIQDSNILARKFEGMLDFLQTSDDNYTRVQLARSSVNANIERWLSEGWLFPHKENTWYMGRDEPPRNLTKNERFIDGRIYEYQRPKWWADRAKQVMDSQDTSSVS
jgi:hypothetical protein